MIIKIKESFLSDYISREAGEKLRKEILSAIKSKSQLTLDFEGLIIASTSFFDEGIAKLGSDVTTEEFSEYVTIKDLNKNDRRVLDQVSSNRDFILSKNHKWRLCPTGHHWVVEHPRKTDSGKTSVEGHCRKNPKNKDMLDPQEILQIAQQHFKSLKVMPSPNDLKFPEGNKYDSIIAGWCQYWNEVMSPETLIHPNIVKALIATESGFSSEPIGAKGHKAIGIMQLMPQTLKYLSLSGKEINNHFIELSTEDAKNPVVNIAAGTRWLFRKYELTKYKLKRSPTWLEVLLDYKGILNDDSKKALEIKENLTQYLKDLK